MSFDRYLQRLGLDREAPTLDYLRRLHRAQVETVPYETIWLHVGESLPADERAALARVSGTTFGGYCFHLNGAFSALLRDLGFDITRHVGGVHPAGELTDDAMHNHLVLQAHGLPDELSPSGDWFVDAGLGDALHEPLPLVAGTYRQGPFEFSLRPSDSSLADWNFVHDPRGSFPEMSFRNAAVDLPVFGPKHEHLSTSPESGFVKVLAIQKRHAYHTDGLRGLVLTRTSSQGVDTRVLGSRAEFRDALAAIFGVESDQLAARHDDLLRKHEKWVALGQP